MYPVRCAEKRYNIRMLNLGERLQKWIDTAPHWEAATLCQERIDRFQERTKLSPKSFHAPLVVALLGGTGTGKSTLLNALLGEKIVAEGKERPTTNEPILVCHSDADTARFSHFRTERRNNPLLEQMMVLDCPDPDTTDSDDPATRRNSNLERLRQTLPFCDILLVTATQQKYRSRRVLDELAAAAPGVRLLFVQTHADRDIDIREDWQKTLEDNYETGQMFFVNSKNPGEENGLSELRQLLTRDLNEEAAIRIRQANYFGLAEEAVMDCRQAIENAWLPVSKLRERISEERQRFGKRMTRKIRSELIRDRRTWESKILGRVSAQWGYSPFSLLLRIYQGFGSLLSGALLTRVRSPIQLALWGSLEGIRRVRNRRTKNLSAVPEFSLEESNQLKESALILTGFATDAHIPAQLCQKNVIQSESKQANKTLLDEISAELESITDRLAHRYQRLWFRCLYEILLSVMLLFLLARPAKNFFYDSLFYHDRLLGIDYYAVSLIWLIVWCTLLLFFFTMTLRKGIEHAIKKTSRDWYRLPALDRLFASLESETTQILTFRDELDTTKELIDRINQQAEKLDRRLGKKKWEDNLPR
jgi:GTPase SAR1 family protein